MVRPPLFRHLVLSRSDTAGLEAGAPVSLAASAISKCVLKGEFDLAVIGSRAGDAAPAGNINRRKAATGEPKVGMIQQVKELGAELHLLPLTYLEVLLQHKIHVEQIRPAQVA